LQIAILPVGEAALLQEAAMLLACNQMSGSVLLDFTTCINERRNGTTAYSSDLFDRMSRAGTTQSAP
jgi:hypothetical protein